MFCLHSQDKSPVVCTGSRSFSEKVRLDTIKSDAVYNLNLDKSRMSSRTPITCLDNTHGFPTDSFLDPDAVDGRSDFISRDSSTGGKVPIYGPRRLVVPTRILGDEFDNLQEKFKVSKSEIANYNAVCALANSSKSR